MVTLPKRIFITGVPGSKWSGVAQILEDLPGFNATDRTAGREYSHSQYSGHKGAYFGKSMEFEANCSNVSIAYDEPDAGCMLAKSHEWANDLRGIQLYQCYKQDDWILLVYRPDLASYNWWYQAGGFTIIYPNYDSYEDDAMMMYQIQKQNANMLNFAYDNNLTWSHFNKKWVHDTFGHLPVGYFPDWKDVLVTMYKPGEFRE